MMSPALEGTVPSPCRVHSGETCAPTSPLGYAPSPLSGFPCRLRLPGWGMMEKLGGDGPPPPPERAAEQGPAARVGPSSRGCSFAQRQPGPGLAPGTFPESLQGPGWEKLLSQCGSLLQQSPLPHHPSEIPSGKIITSSIIIHRKPQLPILIRGAGVALRSAGFKDHKRG